MAFDREAAKKAGYTDQEIDQYLAQQQQGSNEPPPPSTQVPEIDRTNSNMATAAGGAVAAAPYVAGAYGAAKLGGMIPKAIEMLKGAVAPPPGAPTAAPVVPPAAPHVAEAVGENSVKRIAMQGIARGAAGVAEAVAPYAAVAAIPGAMMAHDYQNFKQQTPDQQYQSAQSALAGQSPGQAW